MSMANFAQSVGRQAAVTFSRRSTRRRAASVHTEHLEHRTFLSGTATIAVTPFGTDVSGKYYVPTTATYTPGATVMTGDMGTDTGAISFTFTGTGITGSTSTQPSAAGKYQVTASVAADTTDGYPAASSPSFAFTIEPPPTIGKTAFNINASPAIGSLVGFVEASRPAGDPLTFSIAAAAGSTATVADAFSISPTGRLTVSNPSDLPAIPSGQTSVVAPFQLTATDGTTTFSISDTINVTITGAQPPIVKQTAVTLTHVGVAASSTATVIGDVTATLAYPRQKVNFSLSGTNASLFSIVGVNKFGGADGVITTIQALTPGTYTFNVVATDTTSPVGNPQSATVAVTLNVTQVIVTDPTEKVTINSGITDNPLADAAVVDATPADTVSVTVTTPAGDGTLADPSTLSPGFGAGVTSGASTTYAFTGTAAQATAALAALVYNPAFGLKTFTMPIGISAQDTTQTTAPGNTAFALSPATTVKVIGADILPTQKVTDGAPDSPFANVTLTNQVTGTLTATVTLKNPAMGSLSEGGTTYGSTYTVTGSSSAVNAGIDALVFTPAQHAVKPGNSYAAVFKVAVVSDAVPPVTINVSETVVVTAVSGFSVTGIPSTNTVYDPAPTSSVLATTVSPFASVAITDPNATNPVFGGTSSPETETVTISLSRPGFGVLGGSASLNERAGNSVYTIAAASPSTIASDLQAVVFTPASNLVDLPKTETLTVAIHDAAGVSYTTTEVITINAVPGRLTGLTATLNNPKVFGAQRVGAHLAKLTPTDLVPHDEVTLTLVAGTGDTNNADFKIVDNQLVATTALATGSYSILVEATNGVDTVTQQLTLVLGTTSGSSSI